MLPQLAIHLPPATLDLPAVLDNLARQRLLPRLWARDHTLWQPNPQGVSDRLGWLDSPQHMLAEVPRLQEFTQSLRVAGFSHALLLGMGGSSLAPQVFSRLFGSRQGFLDLAVLESTHPAAVATHADRLRPAWEQTLVIVSTKSGSTVETLSFFKYFYNQARSALGRQRTGEHFIAITDPGSELVDLAHASRFRQVFLNDPHIGGRYSALSFFGLLPAALLGVDLPRLLQPALDLGEAHRSPGEADPPALALGATLGRLALLGRDKLTLLTSPSLIPLADWIEQLIAESTGKQGKGILPVVGEPLLSPESLGADRLFVACELQGEPLPAKILTAISAAGRPLLRLPLADPYQLGAHFLLWELATAIAGHLLGINPFDQPDVEAAKRQTRSLLTAYRSSGSLPEASPAAVQGNLSVFTSLPAASPAQALLRFLEDPPPGAYLALQAYLPPTAEVDAALVRLRLALRARTRLPVTLGYGPRFLHSTGQLHKGDSGKGLFIQLTSPPEPHLPLPNQPGSPASSISFGVLCLAQALGDHQALLDAGRRVIRFHLPSDLPQGLDLLASWL
ncbi:MAG: hypothetical protein PHS96_14985 [Anaerolineales bacterium]|nr:hypothetical protein [Anaerolineales bacterium]